MRNSRLAQREQHDIPPHRPHLDGALRAWPRLRGLVAMDRTDTSLIAIRKILRSTELYGRELARAAGLTAVQIRVLQIVAEQGHTTAKDISTRMGVSQATMSSLIERLSKKHMVAREPSQLDRRVVNIVLTEAGRHAVDTAPDPLQQRYVSKFEALDDWEQMMIVSVLERVATMLSDEQMDVAPVLDFGDFSDKDPAT